MRPSMQPFLVKLFVVTMHHGIIHTLLMSNETRNPLSDRTSIPPRIEHFAD
jgi:hypothetical protein